MKNTIRNAILLATLVAATPAAAWGPTGHRVSADIAQRNINGRTAAQVARILGAVSLIEVSTVPDEQRQNPDPFWQGASSWHRVEVARGRGIAERGQRAGGDSVDALDWAVLTLRDPASDPLSQQRALAFVVHLVADTHLPIHFNAEVLGGGDFPVVWFGDNVSMHWAFEEGLPLRKLISPREYADQLAAHVTWQQAINWWNADPQSWMAESLIMREELYGYIEARAPADGAVVPLGYQFVYDWTPAMEQRLVQSGYRLAAYLDWIFDPIEAS